MSPPVKRAERATRDVGIMPCAESRLTLRRWYAARTAQRAIPTNKASRGLKALDWYGRVLECGAIPQSGSDPALGEA
jgi:transposase